MADIVFINPRFEPSYWGMEHSLPILGAKAVLPTAGLALLGALTPHGHTVTIIDENVEPIDLDRCAQADLVGLTGMIVQRQRMREILAALKARDCFTVVGGPWITVQEDYFGPELVDVTFVGEAEDTWPQFLAEWAQGRHALRYEQTEKTDMSRVPIPRLDLLRMEKYAFGSVQFSRGCPFTCEFCDIIVVFGRRPRIKLAEQVLAELDALRRAGKRDVFIVDDNLIGNKKAIKPILQAVIDWQREHGYPMGFFTEASLDLADDPELMRMMVDANIDTVFMGIETPNEAALRETKKLQNVRGQGGSMLEKIHRVQENGIEVWSGMILGFDNDDAGIFDAQRQFVREARIVNPMVGMLSAIPKTPLYRRLHMEGRLDPADESAYGTNVIPLRIDRATLRDGYLSVLRDLHLPEAYFARLDSLYLEMGLQPQQARKRYMKKHPWRRLRFELRMIAETAVIMVRLLRHVSETRLRHEYLKRMWNMVKRRREPLIWQVYAMKCAMHHHVHTLIREMGTGDASPIRNSF